MSVLDDMGDALARDVLAAMVELDDEKLADKMSKILLDASPTMQEAFLTAYPRPRCRNARAQVP
ncbi:MAG: hypothetical protein V9G14_11890 [Cypionkella sp.]